MNPRLVIAAHGTHDDAGLRTTHAIRDAVAALRPSVDVALAYLDVATPTLASVLDETAGAPAVVVPLLLGAGYHVSSDIPAVVAGRDTVRVAAHLGPDPLVVQALAQRLADASGEPGATTVLAAVGSSRPEAVAQLHRAATLLGERLGGDVVALTAGAELAGRLSALPGPLRVAPYLIAPGDFLARLRAAVGGRGSVAEPIGAHPLLVELVWRRYDAVAG